jgi:hypothetical protein
LGDCASDASGKKSRRVVLSDRSSGTFSTSASSQRLRLLEVRVTPAEQAF